MLRSGLVYLSKAKWAQELVSRWRPANRTARRFVAGESAGDAIRAVKELNRRGILASLDHLGENTTTPEEARTATREILAAFDLIQASGVRANVSIKLSQIGLALDIKLCEQNLVEILEHARSRNNFVRIDMEDSPFTQSTLDLFCAARRAGFGNVGVVLQAYLYRTVQDLNELAPLAPHIRLCKGAYCEPAEVAFPRKADVDANYDRLAAALIDSAASSGAPVGSPEGLTPPWPAIATHDPLRIEFARRYARQAGISQNAIEFQMLYGIRRNLQENLVREGYPVRVYVPYGQRWYPYFMRRLSERPANLWFFVSNFFRK